VPAPALREASLSAGSRPLELRAAESNGREMALVPLHSIFDERYAVYWKTERA